MLRDVYYEFTNPYRDFANEIRDMEYFEPSESKFYKRKYGSVGCQMSEEKRKAKRLKKKKRRNKYQTSTKKVEVFLLINLRINFFIYYLCMWEMCTYISNRYQPHHYQK